MTDADLSNLVESVPERFVPAAARGQLTEAEHFARYLWAAASAGDRRVLDAGCGVGYGTNLLARAGAALVVGVDIADAVIEAARPSAAPKVRFEQGDLTDLTLPSDSFDLVVCLEVIEHLEDREAALREMARVLAPTGILVVSSPNRDVYVPGNPHHVHEYAPEELRAALAKHFPNVDLYRQHDWITSAVMPDHAFADDSSRPLGDIEIGKVVGLAPGQELYTLAVASDAPLPELPTRATMTGVAEVRRWLELWNEQQEVLRGQHEHFQRLRARDEELAALRAELRRSEQALERLTLLEEAREVAMRDVRFMQRRERQLMKDVDDLVRMHEAAQEAADRANRVLLDIQTSFSWRITRPLRAAKRLLA